MHKAILVAPLAVGLIAFAAPASAFCGNGAPQGCTQSFANDGSALQPDGTTSTRQGFNAQNGSQWSTTSHKMGDFTFYSGVSSGNGWGGPGGYMRNGLNAPGFNPQGQPSDADCAFYGTCH
jgi:hypothetical protein